MAMPMDACVKAAWKRCWLRCASCSASARRACCTSWAAICWRKWLRSKASDRAITPSATAAVALPNRCAFRDSSPAITALSNCSVPIQLQASNQSRQPMRRPRLRYTTCISANVLALQYTSAAAARAARCATAGVAAAAVSSHGRALKTAPASTIDAAFAAGVATWLVRRCDERLAAIQPSSATASTAAAGPCSASTRNTTMSAVAIDSLLRGMGIGNAEASATSASQPSSCQGCAACSSTPPAQASANVPTSASTSQ